MHCPGKKSGSVTPCMSVSMVMVEHEKVLNIYAVMYSQMLHLGNVSSSSCMCHYNKQNMDRCSVKCSHARFSTLMVTKLDYA